MPPGRSWLARRGSAPRAGRRARCVGHHTTRRATSARDATDTTSTDAGSSVIDRGTALEALREGEIEIVGRIVASSNNAMLVSVTRTCPDPEPTLVLDAIYKPTLGERPLDDFPD